MSNQLILNCKSCSTCGSQPTPPSRTLNPDQINHIQRGSNWRRKLPLDSSSVMQYPCEGLDFGMGDTGIEPVTISL